MTEENNYQATGMEIAVIGMAGRFPGAMNIGQFWENQKNGVESISFFTREELLESGVETEIIDNPAYVPAYGMCPGLEYFDADFFGFSPREAEIMDPQLRIFQEISWAALEDAGYNPGTYTGLIGVYAGAMYNFEWNARVHMAGKAALLGNFATFLLINKDFLSPRISYRFNLKGPAITVQTACSTSLTAIHMANQAILNGECDIALAGGVSLTQLEKSGYLYQEGMILSPDGHCRAFDEKAKGTISGNGVGVVVLKRLEDAINDHDFVYAIVKGSALNNDGTRKVGFTAPSIDGQAEVIIAAQEMAEVEPESITYIETHGTGTPLGDPVEIEALTLAFQSSNSDPDDQNNEEQPRNYCAIGSVKTNIGHLDAAAGVAGFIKTVLCLHYRLLPPILHFQKPNPRIDFANSPFFVNNKLREWKPINGLPLRAGVSSFGMGGTNAHIILEAAAAVKPQSKSFDRTFLKVRPPAGAGTGLQPVKPEANLILLSAKTEPALERMTQDLVKYFKGEFVHHIQPPQPVDSNYLADAAYTLQVGRQPFRYRRMCTCENLEQFISAFQGGQTGGNLAPIVDAGENDRHVVFMFSGQGAQYINMAKQLYQAQPLFQQQVDQSLSILEKHSGKSLGEILYPSTSTAAENINNTAIAQPLLFIIEYAVAQLLISWGIQPHAMIGHSIGEYVAACLAGVFSLEDALRIVWLRGQLMQQLPGGSMLSVKTSLQELQPLLEQQKKQEGGVSLAAVNSTTLCTVSGNHQAIEQFSQQLEKQGISYRKLQTSHAFHSEMMEPTLEEFGAQLRNISLHAPGIPYISNISGTWITVEEAQDPAYWTAHIRQAVQFATGIEALCKEENTLFVECGPGNTLSTFVRKHLGKQPSHAVFNLVRHPNEELADDHYLIERLGQLWLHGVTIDWEAFNGPGQKNRIPLPTYSFDPTPVPIRFDSKGNLQAQSQILSQRETAPGKKQDIADWFTIPQWKRAEPSRYHRTRQTSEEKPKKGGISTNWLVFMDDHGFGQQIVQALQGAYPGKDKVTFVLVNKGDVYTQQGEHQYTISPGNQDHFLRLIKELREKQVLPQRILYLWSISPQPASPLTVELLEEAQETGFYSLIWLARALGEGSADQQYIIEVITNHLQEVTGGDGTSPQQALALGPVRVIPREYPNIRCRCIDIAVAIPGDFKRKESPSIEQLIHELKFPDDSYTGHQVVALRGRYRWLPTLEPRYIEPMDSLPTQLKPGGVYIITGGMGGMGLTFARYLLETVQGKVVLIGRSKLPPQQEWQQLLEQYEKEAKTAPQPGVTIEQACTAELAAKIRKLLELSRLGGELLVFSGDISDKQQMQEIFEQTRQRFGSINGVIHTAGLEDGMMIQQRTGQESEPVLAPKVAGTVIIEELLNLQEEPVEFIILCSSLASFLAPFGQVAYVSANAFLDAYAQARSNEQPVQPYIYSIDWGTWQSVGMAVAAVEKKIGQIRGKQAGIQAETVLRDEISPAQGPQVLERVLASSYPQVAVSVRDLPGDISTAVDPGKYTAGGSLSGEEKKSKESGQPQPARQRPGIATRYIEPGDELEETLAQIISHFLGLEKIGIDDNFFEIGLSSLDLVQVSALIKEQIGKEIAVVNYFHHSTIRTLARYLEQTGVESGATQDQTTAGGGVTGSQVAEGKAGEVHGEGDAEDLLSGAIDLLNQ